MSTGAPGTLVVGGGASGLALAHRLAAAGGEPVVLEAGPRPGGHLETLREHGFRVELGPNGWLAREPDEPIAALVRELGLADAVVPAAPAARHRFVLRGGRLRRVPASPPALLTSDALSLRGRLRVALEPFARPAPGGEESVYAFARRRIGAEAADVLVDAAVAGITAGDSRQLSVAAAFPQMVEMERMHGSLLRAFAARRGAVPRLVSLADGMGSLAARLAERLGPRLRTGAAVTALAREGGAWRARLEGGGTLAAPRLALACPAWRAAALLEACEPALARALAAFPAAGLAVVALAWRREDVRHDLAGFGYLAARGENLGTLGVVWDSTLFPGRAPAGHVLVRVMLGGARRPELALAGEEELAALARRELAPLLGVQAPPLRAWVRRWPQAIAQYTAGHLERVAAARVLARRAGLELCGTSYDGVSLPAAILSAEAAAARLNAAPAPSAAGAAPHPLAQEVAP